MIELEPCPECSRHVQRDETRCPFCGVPISPANTRIPRLVRQRLGRAARLALGAGFVLACSSSESGAPVPIYGAPAPDSGVVGDSGSDAGAACFSPTQNVDTAYEPGAIGCACAGTEADQCVADSTGRLVALICEEGSWRAVEDGPCGGG